MNHGPYHPAGGSFSSGSLNNSMNSQALSGAHADYTAGRLSAAGSIASQASVAPPAKPVEAVEKMVQPEANSKLATELNQFAKVASNLRNNLVPADEFQSRCAQAFDIANDLFSNAPTWVCFYRELMGGSGLLHVLFDNNKEFGAFLRTDQHHQIQQMLTALRSRDLPENDPNDPQRMITVRLPKSLHEAMCEEAGRLNISVNRLCISRMLQLLDPEMIPETNSKPRGRKPRTRTLANASKSAIASTSDEMR